MGALCLVLSSVLEIMLLSARQMLVPIASTGNQLDVLLDAIVEMGNAGRAQAFATPITIVVMVIGYSSSNAIPLALIGTVLLLAAVGIFVSRRQINSLALLHASPAAMMEVQQLQWEAVLAIANVFLPVVEQP